MFAFWRCFGLIFRLYGDTNHMSDIMYRTGTRIKMNVIPVCCCVFCPTLPPSVRNINIFKGLVLQTFPLRFILLATIDIIRTEGLCDSTVETRALTWVDFISTFTSLWASGVFVGASNENLGKYRVAGLFQVVRLMQTTYNIQRFILERMSFGQKVFPAMYFPDFDPTSGEEGLAVLGPRVQADFWHNILMLLWIMLLSILLIFHMRPKHSAFYTMKRIPIVHVDTEGNFPEALSGRGSPAMSVLSKDSRAHTNHAFDKDKF